MYNTPQRTYFFSDTYGGHEQWNPLQAEDPDARISTDFGVRPSHSVHREFDIYGQEQVTDHILRLILRLHDDFSQRADLPEAEKNDALRLGTGIFINAAPRTATNNGDPFYLALAREGRIRIVTTPLAALASVKNDIEQLFLLPNPHPHEDNGLYDGREQFRSRLTPRLLNPDHSISLVPVELEQIPSADGRWHVSYIDRFGNVVTHAEDMDATWEKIGRQSSQARLRVQLAVGGHVPISVSPTTSLGEATPGDLSIYKNGGIDLVGKWKKGQTPEERLQSSAWVRLGRPRVGTTIDFLNTPAPSSSPPFS